ncbi:VOC family protein [Niallia oryzisoli]|uniref:VOC family protein n=1 Tax=Niallia oryzisoli TaxID=1737571 RepID=UPI003735C821
MINAAHIILYSTNAEADRVFIRDVLGLAGVDAGEGWLIFKLPPAEIAVHPTEGPDKHEFYLMCDDIEKTITELTAKGITISKPISEQGWGRLISIKLPSGADLSIYQPRHPIAYDLEG